MITHVRGLITPLITTHEPSSRRAAEKSPGVVYGLVVQRLNELVPAKEESASWREALEPQSARGETVVNCSPNEVLLARINSKSQALEVLDDFVPVRSSSRPGDSGSPIFGASCLEFTSYTGEWFEPLLPSSGQRVEPFHKSAETTTYYFLLLSGCVHSLPASSVLLDLKCSFTSCLLVLLHT